MRLDDLAPVRLSNGASAQNEVSELAVDEATETLQIARVDVERIRFQEEMLGPSDACYGKRSHGSTMNLYGTTLSLLRRYCARPH